MAIPSKHIVALILAAGESSRLGKPKQNLPYKKTTLLNHIKEHLTLKFVDRTFIVLGAYAKEIIKTSNLSSSEVIEFKGWKEGMGSSLSYACKQIFQRENYDGILITLSDLPLVTSHDYKQMIEQFNGKDDIVATKTANNLGVPAIFGASFFSELENLSGEKGAKPLIGKHLPRVKEFYNERASFDVDTFEEFTKLNED